MIVNVLLTLLWLSGAVYVFAMLRAARAKGQLSLDLESIGLGAVTNFFDTLGIGSFAPTTAYLKLRKMVPDSFIPSTLNAGHCIPTIVEALDQSRQRRPHSADSLYRGGHYRCGLRIRRRHSPAHPDRARRCRRGSCIASGLYALQNLNLMPGGGSALSLAPSWIGVAVAAHVVLGALMTFGIGLYAPSLIMLSLMGLDPKAAFPIMMGACAFLMPALGGIPAVLIAAYAVSSMPLVYLRWGVVAVVLYAAVVLLRAALRPTATDAVSVASS
jgi:hypothetical protein